MVAGLCFGWTGGFLASLHRWEDGVEGRGVFFFRRYSCVGYALRDTEEKG